MDSKTQGTFIGGYRLTLLALSLVLTPLSAVFAACSAQPAQLPQQNLAPHSVAVNPDRQAVTALTPAPQMDGDAQLNDAALIAMGATLYASNCAPCHQPNGEGNLDTFPALNRNAFVTVSNPTAVIDTVLHGREIMPAFVSTLNDVEVAAVISYIRKAWNNNAPGVHAEQVRNMREGLRNE